MSRRKGASVGDHDEKVANERDLGYCSDDEKGGAGDAKKACFPTNIEENSCGGTPTPDSVRIEIGEEYFDQNGYPIIVTEFHADDGKFYLNDLYFHNTGDGRRWQCKNRKKSCKAYIVTTTLHEKPEYFILKRCRFEHSLQSI